MAGLSNAGRLDYLSTLAASDPTQRQDEMDPGQQVIRTSVNSISLVTVG